MSKSVKKPAAKPKPKKVKAEPTERELVERYAKKIINAAKSTMVDRKDLHDAVGGIRKTATMIALDKDFYFSLVFQTADQKYAFLKAFGEKFGLKTETAESEAVDMVNGVKFAGALGIELKKEPLHGFPTPDVQLLPFVLEEV